MAHGPQIIFSRREPANAGAYFDKQSRHIGRGRGGRGMLSGDLKSRPPFPDNILLASFGVSVMCFSLGPLCKSRHWSFTRKLKCGYYNRYIGGVRLALPGPGIHEETALMLMGSTVHDFRNGIFTGYMIDHTHA